MYRYQHESSEEFRSCQRASKPIYIVIVDQITLHKRWIPCIICKYYFTVAYTSRRKPKLCCIPGAWVSIKNQSLSINANYNKFPDELVSFCCNLNSIERRPLWSELEMRLNIRNPECFVEWIRANFLVKANLWDRCQLLQLLTSLTLKSLDCRKRLLELCSLLICWMDEWTVQTAEYYFCMSLETFPLFRNSHKWTKL